MVIHERSESPPISPTPEKSCKGLSLLFLLSCFFYIIFSSSDLRCIDLQSVWRLRRVAKDMACFLFFFSPYFQIKIS